MRLLTYIKEASYYQKDIPENFYVVFQLEDIVEELEKGKISGLKGISSSGEIEFNFLGVARDAMLIMKSNPLLKLNKISRVMYDNPHYFVSNNMDALYRIWNKPRTKNGTSALLFNILDYLKKHIKNSQLKYDADYYGLPNYGWDWSKDIPKIRNLKDLTKFLMNKIEKEFPRNNNIEYNISFKEYYDALYDTLLYIGKIYSSESEWIIKNDVFNVPKNSELRVLYPDFTEEQQKIIEYLTVHENPKPEDLRSIGISQEGIIWSKVSGRYEIERTIRLNKNIKRLDNKYKIVKLNKREFEKRRQQFFTQRDNQ